MLYAAMVAYLMITLFSFSCAWGTAEQGEKDRHVFASEAGEGQLSQPPAKKAHAYAPDEVLVKFRQGTDQEDIKAIQEKLHLTPIRSLSTPGLYLMKINDGTPVEEMVKRLKEFKEVLYSEPNYVSSINRE